MAWLGVPYDGVMAKASTARGVVQGGALSLVEFSPHRDRRDNVADRVVSETVRLLHNVARTVSTSEENHKDSAVMALVASCGDASGYHSTR